MGLYRSYMYTVVKMHEFNSKESFSVLQDIGRQFKYIVVMRKEASSQILKFMTLSKPGAQVYIGHFLGTSIPLSI